MFIKIDDNKLELKFTLACAIAAEKKFGTLAETATAARKIENAAWLTEIMINEAIKKQNRLYNTAIKPISNLEDVCEINGLNDCYEIINQVMTAIFNDTNSGENPKISKKKDGEI